MEIIKYDLPSTDDEDETHRKSLSEAPQLNNEQYANLDLSGPVTWNSMTSFSNFNLPSNLDQSWGQNSQSPQLPDSYETCNRI